MTFTGRKHPSLTGMSGPVTALKMVRMDESSPVRVALIGPGTWGCVPVKSQTNSSSVIVTVTRTGNGP